MLGVTTVTDSVSQVVCTIEALVAAREARGLSVSDVASRLNIPERRLLLLESSDWNALPGLAFTRAVVRSYGRIADVDVSPLVESLSQNIAPAALAPGPSMREPVPSRGMFGFGSGRGGSRWAWMLLTLVGAIAFVLFFGSGRLGGMQTWLADLSTKIETPLAVSSRPSKAAEGLVQADSSSMASPTGRSSVEPVRLPALTPEPSTAVQSSPGSLPQELAQSAVAPGSSSQDSATPDAPGARKSATGLNRGEGAYLLSAPATGANAVSTGNIAATSPSASVPADAVAAAPESSATSVTSATTSATPATTSATPAIPSPTAAVPDARVPRIRMHFDSESWIEIRSAEGQVLLTGVQPQGTSRDFDEAGALGLVIGNARDVRLELDGQPFDLGPHTRVSVARFNIP